MAPADLLFKLERPGAVLPCYGTDAAIGLDLHACRHHIILPGERREIPTGVSVAIPAGYYGRIAPRSGLAFRHGLDVLAGVIDADYRGELIVILINLGHARVVVRHETRIAQLILERADRFIPRLVEALPSTDRGERGFGSTGL